MRTTTRWFTSAVGILILLLTGLTARGEWVAAGGTVTNYSTDGTNYTAHIFTASGPFVVNSNLNCNVLLVGGGGGGGETIGGGGGGGGVIASNAFNVAIGNYTVTVGSGGAGGWGTGYPAGAKGGDSILLALTAIGGGAGAGYNVNAVGTGGSAGGNGGNTGVRAGYTADQGNDGGTGSGNNAGGGGGGAAQTGAAAAGSPVNGGKGGDGVTHSISGTPTVYAGGGGGGTRTGYGVGGAGGLGGGGAGGTGGNPGTNGTANTGGGGGGGGYLAEMPGGSGGSGIVIVRYVQVPVTVTPPAVTNLGATNVQYTTAMVQGQVSEIGGKLPNVWFHYWMDGSASTSTVPMGQQYDLFSTLLAGLAKGSTYQFLLMASNSAGTVWSDQRSFTTKSGAASYYVAPTVTGLSDGSSWATAFTDLQTAIDPCVAGDTVYIKGGAYSITNQLVWMQSGVTILGAYEGTNASGPGAFSIDDWPTLLGRPASAPASRILLVSGVTDGTLSRLSLTNGRLNGWSVQVPGATGGCCIAVDKCADLQLSSLTVAGGYFYSYQPLVPGVGVFIGNSTNVTLAGSTIRDNNGYCANNDYLRGSGVYAGNSTVTITNCVLRNNYGGYAGGGSGRGALGHGMHLKNCLATVVDTTIIGNYCSAANNHYSYGAGVYADGGTNTFRNCLIAGNDNRGAQTIEPQGDGVYLNAGASTFASCTLIRNNGQGIYYKAGAVTVTNCILWDNLDDLANFPTGSQGELQDVFTSCVEDGDNNGTNGCIAADPLFERGLYLATNSPCVDRGGGSASDAGLGGYTTRADGTLDTGAVDLGYHLAFGILASPLAELYVSPAGSDANSGTNWAGAFRSVTKALSVAEHGTHIHIGAGLYNTTVEKFPLTINRTFGLELLGTNAATTTFLGPAGGDANGLLLRGVSYVRIQGVTLANHGNHSADMPITGGGAGMSHSRVTIASCTFRDSTMSGYHSNKGPGAGLWAKDSFLTMTNCAIYGNKTASAGGGGGIYVLNGELALLDSAVSNNWAGPAGGGLYLTGNRGGNGHVVSNCVFVGNKLNASGTGGGLYVAATATVQNCVFATNRFAIGSGTGGGVFVGGGFATLRNCTVADNAFEGVRQNTADAVLTIRNSVLWGNGDDVVSADMPTLLSNLWYSDVQDGDNDGTNGCLSADPLFVDPASLDWHVKSVPGHWTADDVWVRDSTDSPCVDAGDPTSAWTREPWPNGERINMGAYGNTPQASKTPGYELIVLALPASDYTFSTATLNGQVSDVGGLENPRVFFCWGASNGGSANTGAWEHVVEMGTNWGTGMSFSLPLSDLLFGNRYYYQVFATNAASAAWSSVGQTFLMPREWYVSLTGDNSAATNWATAYTNLQTALNAATNLDVIYVRGGVQGITTPPLTWTQSGLTILGSYEGTNGTGPGNYSVAMWPTILTRPSGAASSRILSVSGVNGGTLTRVTITGGSAGPGCGANIVDSRLTMDSCTISNNTGWPINGGGIWMNNTFLTVTNCAVVRNTARSDWASYGGGVYAQGGQLTLVDSLVAENAASPRYGGTAGGAGVYLATGYGGAPHRIRNCVFRGNRLTSPVANIGGGLYVASTTEVYNCLFVSNGSSAGSKLGSGIFVEAGRATIGNCTVVDNPPEGIRQNTTGDRLAIRNSILWNNGDDLYSASMPVTLSNLSYSDIEDGDNNGTNECTAADPRFERGVCLATNSPCLDSGGDTAAAAGLEAYTTRADGTLDTGPVDLGYHGTGGILNTPVADLYVSAGGSDGNAGTNWANAFRSITKALSVATDGTHVHVAAGLYDNTCETFPLTIDKTGLELLGTNAAATVVKPTGSGKRGFMISGASPVRLEGLTVAGANPGSYTPGCGVYLVNSRLTMASCIVSNNSGWPINGGGIWMNNTFLTVTNCTVARNTARSDWASYGGGIYAEGGQLTLLNSLVASNAASPGSGGKARGGGIYLTDNCGSAVHRMANCTVLRNRLTCPAVNQGAGLYVAATALVQNCVIATNGMTRGSKLGAGVFVANGRATLENCTVVGNPPEGIRQNTTGDRLVVRNSILWDNGDDLASSNAVATLSNLRYSDLEDGDNNGTNGCVSADPLFADAVHHDYHLLSHGGRWTEGDVWVRDSITSPCIDAGDPADGYALEPNPNGHRVNMGAYGNTAQASLNADPRGTMFIVR